jgi:hypothetical protein
VKKPAKAKRSEVWLQAHRKVASAARLAIENGTEQLLAIDVGTERRFMDHEREQLVAGTRFQGQPDVLSRHERLNRDLGSLERVEHTALSSVLDASCLLRQPPVDVLPAESPLSTDPHGRQLIAARLRW